MQTSMLAGGLLATLALVLAGCSGTGNFDVQQTEPFRVQLEGDPQTVVVSEDDADAKEVVVVTCNDCDDADQSDDRCTDPCSTAPKSVNVQVQVTPKAAAACVIKVIIKDRATGEVLHEGEVSGGSGNGSSTMTSTASGNASTTMTTTATTQTNVVVQNFVVNVKGNHNIVVLTQALQGSANVAVSASHATGNGQADAGSSAGATGTSSASTSAAPTSTSTTSTGY